MFSSTERRHRCWQPRWSRTTERALHVVCRLLRTGRRRLAYLGNHLAIATAQDRFDGFLGALDETSAPSDPVLVRRGLRSVEQTRRAILELLDTNPCRSPA